MASNESEQTPKASSSEEPILPEVQTTKRIFAGKSEVEIPEPKRARSDYEYDPKTASLALTLHWHEYLIRHFKITNVHRIDSVAEVTSHICTMHTKFMTYEKGINDDYEFTANGVGIKWKDVKLKMKEIAILYNFTYGQTTESLERTRTLSAILSLTDAYSSRFNEVRVGTKKINVRTAGTLNQIPISTFGLGRQEHSLLTAGCTYTPMVQARMKCSLGPMTIAINLANSEHPTPWKEAFVRVFKLFPKAEEIADTIVGTRMENFRNLSLLADICLRGAARSTRTAFFPASMLLVVARINAAYKEFFEGETPNTRIAREKLHEKLLKIDYSDSGAFLFWMMAQQSDFMIRTSSDMTIRTMKEIVFHSVWGTHIEDLGILEWMTDHNFQNRKQMGKQLIENDHGNEVKSFPLIPFKRIAKFAKVSENYYLSRIPMRFVSMFSFYRIQRESSLFQILRQSREETVGYGSYRDNGANMFQKLLTLKRSIDDKVGKDPPTVFGTTQFFEFNKKTGYGDFISNVPPMAGLYFYG